MTFAHPYLLLLLLALPVLAWLQGRRGTRSAFLYSSLGLVKDVARDSRSRAGSILAALRWLALALLLVAFARPQQTESETSVTASGVDIVMALDLSSSMESEDLQLGENRLTLAKAVSKTFIARRPNDRIGLVAFAGKAYIAAPLTLDHDFLLANLERLQLRTIEDGTAIGSGLSASVNRLRDVKSKSKIVILLTDGQNNAGTVSPLTAAEAAQSLHMKVYTIGVGVRGMSKLPYLMFGRKMYRDVPVDIDEPTLQAIADRTGGKYYRADSPDTLKKIFSEIDQLEKTEVEVKKFVRRYELFHWFVLPGLGLLLLELLLGNTVWRKLP